MKRLFSASEPAPDAPGAAQASQPPAAAAAGDPPRASAAALSFEQRDGVNGTYFSWLFENADVTGLDTTPHENQVLDALTAILASQQSGAALVRRLPGLLPQLLQSLRSDNFSGAQLSRTISNDVVLVAAVIRMANTSFKGSGTTITSVEHAVMLIGQEGLRHLITSVAFRPIIDLNSGQYTRLLAPRIWDQSERCAVANRMLAEAMGVDPFEAFLAGLVQNVGLIVTLRIMDQMSRGEKELGSEMFCARLVRDARILTCSIGREWNFPESVVTAIGEQAGMRKGVAVSPLGQLLTQSDYLSKVRILVDNDRLGHDDPVLFKGLSAQAMAVYRQLDAIEDDVVATPSPATPAP
ncbi:HDOD domain-containing protein [Massilia violaceinigra]|uniref:HDOD domain-containing protein n=1 Tax=Massilia violaceinigra TaxID=2045208 RepID=UPI001FB400A8|nr:HDOD domain-containing protein [Massilia violaceinigra]